MGLKEYQQKRHFQATPEPQGKTKPRKRGALRFVVQKHRARRTHYDFRLELDGVLKSWAVPKGPSLDPSEKRLAVMVEDHPLEYRTFEGIIPAGNYGAGTVMVWDEGTYEPLDAPNRAEHEAIMRQQLDKGHLRIVLHGEKLQGSFSMVRTRTSKNWLMFKRSDDYASGEDVLAQDSSALTRRTMDEIAQEAPRLKQIWQSNRPDTNSSMTPAQSLKAKLGAIRAAKGTLPAGAARSRKQNVVLPAEALSAKMPRNIKPMLAMLVEQPFDRAGWLFEVKWDGYRAIAEVEKGKVRLYSRKQLSYEERYGPVNQALAELDHDAVLDGEVVALDAEGKAQFEFLQNYQRTGHGTLIYYVFDLLYLDGKDLRDLPLRERKERARKLIQGLPNVRLSEHVEEKGIDFFEAAGRMGLEGIVAKKADSRYREGRRSDAWLKLKIRKQQEAVIGGFTEPRGSRDKIGSLVLGLYEGNDLVHIGNAGSGFNTRSLAEVYAKLEPLAQKACPFKTKPKTDTKATWVKPELVCEVAFQNWTSEGIARFPIFLGLREDKEPHAVKREEAAPLPDELKGARTMSVRDQKTLAAEANEAAREGPASRPGEKSALPAGKYTNLDKVYWPEDGYTKGDLLGFYHDIAPFILPYLNDRPMSLNRHPDGIHGENFFQKDVSRQKLPDFIQTADVPSEHRGANIRFLLCQNEPTLLYCGNLGCIELNPWNSRTAALEHPDYLIIDLDPQEVAFEHVVAAAQEVRKIMEKGGSPCYCKTSGKRGLHVYIPLAAKYHYDQVRQFAEIIAHFVRGRLPATTSLERNPVRRRDKVYIDFLQNRRGQTMAAAYSLRPVPGAVVSTPLDWKEVGKRLDPASYNLKTIRQRLDKVGDLWAPVLGPGIDLTSCLTMLSG